MQSIMNRLHMKAMDRTVSAIIVDALTDNKNRTAANVRSAFTKGKGSLGTQGCVSYMFDKKGQIIIDKEECDMDADDLMMMALDAGAEDFTEEEDSFEIVLTDPDDFSVVREALEQEKIAMADAEVTMIPQTYVELTDETGSSQHQQDLDLCWMKMMTFRQYIITGTSSILIH